MNLIITKWLLVYVCEHKHNFHVIHFLSLSVIVSQKIPKDLMGLDLFSAIAELAQTISSPTTVCGNDMFWY